MRVSSFMVPAAQVTTCHATDTIDSILGKMLKSHISAIVVIDETNKKPLGIITKTDMAQAYKNNLPLFSKVSHVMERNMKMVFLNQPRDRAARVFEDNCFHHAIVVDEETGEFCGLISTLDIARECVKDDRAWPWNRPETGNNITVR